MRRGIRVVCATCNSQKRPRGRSVSPALSGFYCDSDCPGYLEDPQPGSLWPGETEEDFGYPISDHATEEVTP